MAHYRLQTTFDWKQEWTYPVFTSLKGVLEDCGCLPGDMVLEINDKAIICCSTPAENILICTLDLSKMYGEHLERKWISEQLVSYFKDIFPLEKRHVVVKVTEMPYTDIFTTDRNM
eukprot:snap_masked-scaffold_7-processed-gene-6.11-mRNA-1 protein AED:1.00 eAED:1.00 QI:0/-1/0/0/-1/1/1/0/115